MAVIRRVEDGTYIERAKATDRPIIPTEAMLDAMYILNAAADADGCALIKGVGGRWIGGGNRPTYFFEGS